MVFTRQSRRKSFYGDRWLPASGQRLRRLVSPSAAHLHRLIGNSPRGFGCPHFAHRCFDAQIPGLPIEQRRGEEGHRFHGKNVACHLCDLSGNGSMFTDRHAPLDAFARPFPRDLQQSLGKAYARGRQREPPCVQRGKRDFQSGAFLRDDVFPRHAHVGEIHDCVIKRAQPHEPAAIRDLEPWCIHIDNERRDLLALFSAHDLWRRTRHHHKHTGFHPIGAPKFFAI